MMKQTTFLISALAMLILANVLMMSYSSPVFSGGTAAGFVSYMEGFKNKKEKKKGVRRQGFENPPPMLKPRLASQKEPFANYSGSPAGAKDSYEPIGAFDSIRLAKDNEWRYNHPNEPLKGQFPKFEPGPDNLFMFKDNQCKPECCGSSYACDGGCVCTTPEQRNFINMRGGNRTAPDAGV